MLKASNYPYFIFVFISKNGERQQLEVFVYYQLSIMKILTFLTTFFMLVLVEAGQAQKTLNLYKPGRFKVIQFKIGDMLQFKMKGDDYYYTLPIQDLIGDKIIFPTGEISIHSISAIKHIRNKGLAHFLQNTGKSLYVFAGSWMFYTGVDVLYGGNPLTWAVAIVSGTAVALGWVLTKLSGAKVYKLNDKRFLKILEPDKNNKEKSNE